MNLHEECLLKYLLNPIDLINTTEILKINNANIEKSIMLGRNLKRQKTNYIITRI